MKLASRTKILIYVLCLLLVLCTSVVMTMAYLVDTDETVNTFTIGQVHIKLDEAVVDANGNLEYEADGTTLKPRVTGNEYHLIPGQTYVKDPTLSVIEGSEAAYVRMTVTLNKADILKSIFGTGFLPEHYVDGWDRTTWECVNITESTDGKNLTYEFHYRETDANSLDGTVDNLVDASKASGDLAMKPLFEKFTVPGVINGDQLKALAEGEGFKITVNGHAIQAAGFASEDLAWAAFDEQYAREQAQQP